MNTREGESVVLVSGAGKEESVSEEYIYSLCLDR